MASERSMETDQDPWSLGQILNNGYSFVGVVADISRSMESDYNAKTTFVFGLTEDEYNSVKRLDGAIKPAAFMETAPRFKVHLNPFLTMRILGERHGYSLPAQPLIAQAKCSDSKVVVIWTLTKQ